MGFSFFRRNARAGEARRGRTLRDRNSSRRSCGTAFGQSRGMDVDRCGLSFRRGRRRADLSDTDAAGLCAIGIRHGDRVALLADSRVEWTLTDAGCLFAGAVDVPIYPTLTPPQVRYILQDSGARALCLPDREKFV